MLVDHPENTEQNLKDEIELNLETKGEGDWYRGKYLGIFPKRKNPKSKKRKRDEYFIIRVLKITSNNMVKFQPIPDTRYQWEVCAVPP